MWGTKELYTKSCVYARRGHSELSGDEGVGILWLIMGYELLLRSALSKIHPSLLVDLGNEGSLLYANGIMPEKNPKSASISTILIRASSVVKNFNKQDVDRSLVWIGHRNEELHSAGEAIASIDVGKFIPEYYGVLDKLLSHLGKDFKDYLGRDDGASAEKVLAASRDDKRKEVHEIVKLKRDEFNALDVAKRLELIKDSKGKSLLDRGFSKSMNCPACEGSARVFGELIRVGEVKVGDDDLTQDYTYMPSELRCYACGLNFKGMDKLFAFGISSPFVVTGSIDPAEYYNIERAVDPGDEYQDE